jgi:nicotinamide mononucleotide transporter
MHFFDIHEVLIQVLGYPISYVEFTGTIFGLVSIYLATRTNIYTWSTGIVNEVLAFILFFQVQLYADMFLQIYFFIVTLYGWYNWNKKSDSNKITEINLRNRIILVGSIIIGSLIAGYFFSNIHLYLPEYFTIKAAYPYTDSFVMVSSIVGTFLLAKKKIENWYLWIPINLVCVALYFKKEVYFVSFEYLIFLGLSVYGYYNWKKQLCS